MEPLNLENCIAVDIKSEEHFLDECTQRNIKIFFQKDSFYIIEKPFMRLYFVQNTYEDLSFLSFQSIKEAATKLKSLQALWVHHSWQHHRRGELIHEHLIPIRKRNLDFLKAPPKGNLGAYALWDHNTLLVMKKSQHALPFGEVLFNENKTDPPSRAYLKLWELFTLYEQPPKAGETVMDLGSCPGGWAWVLANLGLNVISVDKATIDSKLLSHPNIQFVQESAFSLDPLRFQQIQWVFSDIIAYPDALLKLIENWHTKLPHAHLVFTIKLQGQTDFKTLDTLANYPNATIYHLFNNKHEICWVYKASI